MAILELKNIVKHYGGVRATDAVSLAVERGRLVGLLGPSGCGKTTLLRQIAGLETPDSGEVYIGGRRVNDIAPGERGIGFVFQSYALFRHLTVWENIAFGLRSKGAAKSEIKERVAELLELTRLTEQARRYPGELSGGQRQRVAFARALAPRPELLLLDEPFAAIDAKVRRELRSWLREIIHQLGLTSIFVTHDQDEAVEVADEIVIMSGGHIEQSGPPREIYQRPATPFVARFIGEGTIVAGCDRFRGFAAAPDATGIIRPEFIEIGASPDELPLPLAAEEGIVRDTYFRGSVEEVAVEVNGTILTGWRSLERAPLTPGARAYVLIHRIYSFDAGGLNVLENSAAQRESVII